MGFLIYRENRLTSAFHTKQKLDRVDCIVLTKPEGPTMTKSARGLESTFCWRVGRKTKESFM